MATRTWKGGGDNKASSPHDWRDVGIPQPGDTLTIASQHHPASYTINIHGYDLAGNWLTIGSPFGPRTRAIVPVTGMVNTDATFNLSQRSSLNLTVDTGAHVGSASAVINIAANDIGYVWLTNNESPVTVNLGAGTQWLGSLTMGFFGQPAHGLTTVNGGVGSAFSNGASAIGYDNAAVINTDVAGYGSFDLTANLPGSRPKLEFAYSVSANQSVTDQGVVQIDRPDLFQGAITLKSLQPPDYNPAAAVLPAEIDLMGLATADSYSFQNDMLSIFAGNSVIDTLRLHDATTNGFAVQKDADSVNIMAITDPSQVGIGLPVHV